MNLFHDFKNYFFTKNKSGSEALDELERVNSIGGPWAGQWKLRNVWMASTARQLEKRENVEPDELGVDYFAQIDFGLAD